MEWVSSESTWMRQRRPSGVMSESEVVRMPRSSHCACCASGWSSCSSEDGAGMPDQGM